MTAPSLAAVASIAGARAVALAPARSAQSGIDHGRFDQARKSNRVPRVEKKSGIVKWRRI
jgi:hypothetical protein